MNASFPTLLLDEAEKNLPHDLLSKADFLYAAKTLAGNLSKPSLAGPGTNDMETVFVACPFDAWKQTFGEPRGVVACQSAIQAWEQRCSDGVVHCVGYLLDDPHDGQCVVLTRVCLF
ncbi:MAG: hypothetical protein ACLP9L_29890 [Thermoguttaceae bacterium]